MSSFTPFPNKHKFLMWMSPSSVTFWHRHWFAKVTKRQGRDGRGELSRHRITQASSALLQMYPALQEYNSYLHLILKAALLGSY